LAVSGDEESSRGRHVERSASIAARAAGVDEYGSANDHALHPFAKHGGGARDLGSRFAFGAKRDQKGAGLRGRGVAVEDRTQGFSTCIAREIAPLEQGSN